MCKRAECPVCGGDATPLGALCLTTWLRCRDCGAEWTDKPQTEETADADVSFRHESKARV